MENFTTSTKEIGVHPDKYFEENSKVLEAVIDSLNFKNWREAYNFLYKVFSHANENNEFFNYIDSLFEQNAMVDISRMFLSTANISNIAHFLFVKNQDLFYDIFGDIYQNNKFEKIYLNAFFSRDENLINKLNNLEYEKTKAYVANFFEKKYFIANFELILSKDCPHKCIYCYYSNYGDLLYEGVTKDDAVLLNNTKKIINFLLKNNLFCVFDLFSGDIFYQSFYKEFFNILLEYFKEINKKLFIDKLKFRYKIYHPVLIPVSDYSMLKFISDEDFKNSFKKEIVDVFMKNNVRIALSLSVDGPFMDYKNRPSILDKTKDNESFYSKIVKIFKEMVDDVYFDRKTDEKIDSYQQSASGLHPMVYSSNIQYWIDNYIWFSEKTSTKYSINEDGFIDFNILHAPFYMLEVRNTNWRNEEVLSMFYLIQAMFSHISIYLFKNNFTFLSVLNRDKNIYDYVNNVNFFNSYYSTIGRGLGCSLQTSLALRLQDMGIVACHRQSYKENLSAYIDIDDNYNLKINAKNVEFYIFNMTLDKESLGACSICAINRICPGPCIGANYEATGDGAYVHPNVCRMEYFKSLGFVKSLLDHGIYRDYIKLLDRQEYESKAYSLEFVGEKLMKIFNYNRS